MFLFAYMDKTQAQSKAIQNFQKKMGKMFSSEPSKQTLYQRNMLAEHKKNKTGIYSDEYAEGKRKHKENVAAYRKHTETGGTRENFKPPHAMK